MSQVPEIPAGTWVAVEQTVLWPGERAPGLPPETAAVPLVARVKGFLLSRAAPGESVLVRTAVGREVEGILREVNPPYTHGFGELVPEILTIGAEVRLRLRAGRREG